jgi:hypothetical protein
MNCSNGNNQEWTGSFGYGDNPHGKWWSSIWRPDGQVCNYYFF